MTRAPSLEDIEQIRDFIASHPDQELAGTMAEMFDTVSSHIPDLRRITRVCVVGTSSQIVFENYEVYAPPGAYLAIQDEGRTLKILPQTRELTSWASDTN